MMRPGALVLLSFQRKGRHHCAFLAYDAVLTVQERSSVTCTPLVVVHSLHSSTTDGAHCPEVNNLLGLLYIKLISATRRPAALLAHVLYLISVDDEANNYLYLCAYERVREKMCTNVQNIHTTTELNYKLCA